MYTRLFTSLAFAALLVPAPPTGRPDPIPTVPSIDLAIVPESQLWIEGTSTVRDYKCRAAELSGTIKMAPGSNHVAVAVADLGAAVLGVELEIPVARLDCDNNTMDGHLRKALQAENHPVIHLAVASHEVELTEADAGQIKMLAELTIAGTTQAIELIAAAVPGADGKIHIRGSKEIQMTEYGVKPPRLMLGTLRVNERVTVHYDMVLQP